MSAHLFAFVTDHFHDRGLIYAGRFEQRNRSMPQAVEAQCVQVALGSATRFCFGMADLFTKPCCRQQLSKLIAERANLPSFGKNGCSMRMKRALPIFLVER